MAGQNVPVTAAAHPADGPAGPRRDRRRTDLRAQPFPEVTAAAAADPAAQRETLALLRTWAEGEAEAAIDWYLRDKRTKRVASRLLQGLAIAFAVAGTAVPLGTAASGGSGQGWGYVLLAVAAGCKGFDHFFGVSAGWMRDMGVAHSLRTELNAVRLEWAADVLRAGPGLDTPGRLLEPAEVERQLALVQRLAGAVRSHVDGETAEWQAAFSSSTSQLQGQSPIPGADR